MKKVLFVIIFLTIKTASGQLVLDLETGSVFTGFNHIRIPGNTGTFFPVQQHLSQDFNLFVRGRTSISWAEEKHTVSILAAPLKIRYQGQAPYDIRFRNTGFLAGNDLSITYRFDSYRLTYRYNFLRSENLLIGAGLTVKVRDASIRYSSGSISDEETDLGLVPLINFRLHWLAYENLAFSLDGDALAAPMGRAEDIALFINWQAYRNLWLKAGYRILEGGADNDQVYTFSLFHYAAIGVKIIF